MRDLRPFIDMLQLTPGRHGPRIHWAPLNNDLLTLRRRDDRPPFPVIAVIHERGCLLADLRRVAGIDLLCLSAKSFGEWSAVAKGIVMEDVRASLRSEGGNDIGPWELPFAVVIASDDITISVMYLFYCPTIISRTYSDGYLFSV